MRVHNKEKIQYKKSEKFLLPLLFQFLSCFKLYKKEKGIFKFGILQLTHFCKEDDVPERQKTCCIYVFVLAISNDKK